MVAVVARSFCTLFDLSYLARGLITCRSLRRVLPDAEVTVLCMDLATKRILDDLREPGEARPGLDVLHGRGPEQRINATRTSRRSSISRPRSSCRNAASRDQRPT